MYANAHRRALGGRNHPAHTQAQAQAHTRADPHTLAHAHTQNTHAHMPRVVTCTGSHQEQSSLRSTNLVPLCVREARASERMNGTRRNIRPFAQPLNPPAHELCSVFSAPQLPGGTALVRYIADVLK